MIDQYDQLEIRCPMLGHPLKFSYCRSTTDGKPCRKIRDCWYTRIPIQDFLQQHFASDVLRGFDAAPRAKVSSLVELIEQAKARNENLK